MDKVERQLSEDARAIDPALSENFTRRLNAAIDSTSAGAEPSLSTRRPAILWWSAGLAGTALAILAVAVLDRGGMPEEPGIERGAGRADPGNNLARLADVPLNVETADFTSPLAEELENLKSDMDKARARLGEDLRGAR